jgi:hypothetical protein
MIIIKEILACVDGVVGSDGERGNGMVDRRLGVIVVKIFIMCLLFRDFKQCKVAFFNCTASYFSVTCYPGMAKHNNRSVCQTTSRRFSSRADIAVERLRIGATSDAPTGVLGHIWIRIGSIARP